MKKMASRGIGFLMTSLMPAAGAAAMGTRELREKLFS